MKSIMEHVELNHKHTAHSEYKRTASICFDLFS